MLHLIPESKHRGELLKVVGLQEKLVKALCALAAKKKVDIVWLQAIWKKLPRDWVDRFWTNDKARRSGWLKAIAAASKPDKAAVLAMWKQQMQFAKLYDVGTKFRLDPCDRSNPVMAALVDLLTAFYDPLLYGTEGVPIMQKGAKVNKDQFILGFSPKIKVCPYTDYPIPSRATKLDHFLPKERFPALSCHPDNLYPCSTDANNGGRKGTIPPLDLNEAVQAAAWFHPRLRSACEKFSLEVGQNSARQPTLRFLARSPEDQPRLDKLDGMFHLTESWAGYLDDEIGQLGNTVSLFLKVSRKAATFDSVREVVIELAKQRIKDRKSGSRALAISESFYYQHVANSRYLLNEVLRACKKGT